MSDVKRLIEELEAGLEGVTPGPWSHCTGGCECTAILAADHPVAEVTKGDWGDDYPSLRFKEGFEGSIAPAAVEAYMAQATYGHVSVETAMRNRAHIARCSPDNIRSILNSHARLIEALERAREAIASVPVETFGVADHDGLSDPYPIQAELLHNIDLTLTQVREGGE